MSKIVSFFLAIAMTIFFAGCRIQYIPVPVETKVDSIYVEKIVERVDTLKIEIPSETIYVVKKDSSHLETSVAISEAVVDSSGLLHHKLENKKTSLGKEVVYKDRIIEKEKIVEKEVPVVQKVEKIVEVVPKYYRWVSAGFWLIIVGFVIFIVTRIKVRV